LAYTYISTKLFQDICEVFTAEQASESLMVVDEVLGTHKLPVSVWGELVIWHPLPFLPWPASYFVCPFLQSRGIHKLMLCLAENEITILLELGDLGRREW
jgi:hypothetical protein